MAPPTVTTTELLERYDGLLLDAYGVLVDGRGALPGAIELIAELDRRGTPFAVVTNDASRSATTYVARLAAMGIPIRADRIVSSGSLLPDYFRAHALAGARTCILGTDDSVGFVVDGGGVPIPLAPGMEIDVVAVCDDAGTPFLEGIELALSAIVRAIEAGRRPTLVLPNPDLVYPKGDGELGVTAGAMALVLEAALERRFPGDKIVFDRLGKPAPHLLEEARRRLGVTRVVMIGDQLETDVAAAHRAGIDSALIAGVSRWDARAPVTPTYLLRSLAPCGRSGFDGVR